MSHKQRIICEMTDCIHCQDGHCLKEGGVTIREHRCSDFKARIVLSDGTVTIEVKDGVVHNVFASPDLPPISVELIDFDDLHDASDDEYNRARELLHLTAKLHKHIF